MTNASNERSSLDTETTLLPASLTTRVISFSRARFSRLHLLRPLRARFVLQPSAGSRTGQENYDEGIRFPRTRRTRMCPDARVHLHRPAPAWRGYHGIPPADRGRG